MHRLRLNVVPKPVLNSKQFLTLEFIENSRQNWNLSPKTNPTKVMTRSPSNVNRMVTMYLVILRHRDPRHCKLHCNTSAIVGTVIITFKFKIEKENWNKKNRKVAVDMCLSFIFVRYGWIVTDASQNLVSDCDKYHQEIGFKMLLRAFDNAS